MLPESFDYAILDALNPHRPPEPEAVPEPGRPEGLRGWKRLSEEEQEQVRRAHDAALERRREYERAYAAWQAAPETRAAAGALARTVRDLEQRGLLQYDRQSGRWDLHPVVRAVAFSRLRDQDRDHLGQKIIDHFSQRPHDPYEQADTLEDLQDGITVVRTLIQMGRQQDAWSSLQGDLLEVLLFNMEAYPESLSLLRPFFSHDWSALTEDLAELDLGGVASGAAIAFSGLGEFMQAVELGQAAVRTHVAFRDWQNVWGGLINLSEAFYGLNRLALSERYNTLALHLAEALGSPAELFTSRLNYMALLAVASRWDEAEEMWNLLNPMGRDWPRYMYRPGDAEQHRLEFVLFPRGRLTEEDLAAAERLARTGQNRRAIRSLHRLRGEWRLAGGEHALAVESLRDAIRMAHESGFPDPESETLLALARFHLKQLPASREEALRLSAGRDPSHLPLAELWHALADTKQAAEHAKAAYRHAWADGEPYVRRHALDRARTLLWQLGEDIPALPAYDPAQHPGKPWEDEITAAITELRKPAQPKT